MDGRSLINLFCTLASALASISNLASLRYVYKTYDVSQGLFHILVMDTAFASICSMIGLGNSLYQIFDTQPNPWTCTLVIVPAVCAVTQPILNGFISLIRYKRIEQNNPNGWKTESELIKISSGTFLGFLFYAFSAVISNTIFDLGLSTLYDACMNEEKRPSPGAFILMFPALVSLISTACLDFKSLKILQKRHQNIQHEIPFRATLISICLTIPYFLFSFMVAIFRFVLQVDQLVFYLLILILNFVVILLKNPLVLSLAFRVNDDIRNVDLEEDRERRRQVEIQDALKAREERRKQKQDLETEQGKNELQINTISGCLDAHKSIKSMPNVEM